MEPQATALAAKRPTTIDHIHTCTSHVSLSFWKSAQGELKESISTIKTPYKENYVVRHGLMVERVSFSLL